MSNIVDLLQRRMALVEKIAALNSEQLSNTQARSGVEVELLACIEEIEETGETSENPARRVELEARYKAAAVACTDCGRERDDLSQQLNRLDEHVELLDEHERK